MPPKSTKRRSFEEWMRQHNRRITEPIIRLTSDYLQDHYDTLPAVRGMFNELRKEAIVKGEIRHEDCEMMSGHYNRNLPDKYLFDVDEKLFHWLTCRKRRDELNKQLLGLLPGTILVISDLHIPYHDEKAFWRCIERFQDAKAIVFNGDSMNCDGVGAHKDKSGVRLIDQVTMFSKLVIGARRVIPNIYLSLGNHEEWFSKLMTMLSADKEAFNQAREVIEAFMGPLSLGDILQKKMEFEVGYGNLLRVGDCLIAHPACYGSTPGSTTQWMIDHLDGWGPELGVKLGSYSTLICGHTHHVTKIMPKQILQIEAGCLCHPIPYVFSKVQAANKKNRWHTACGYVTLDSSGHVDYNETGFWLA